MALTTDPGRGLSSRINNKAAASAMNWTPSDANYLADAGDKPIVSKGILVTVAGNLELVFSDQALSEAVIVPVAVNTYYPFSVKMIKAASTTATGIKVFY